WGAIPYFRSRMSEQLRVGPVAKKLMRDRLAPVGLALACGDMAGEYGFFKRTGITEVDAYDISPGQRDKFYDRVYDGEIEVNYLIADVNEIQLPENRYDLVYLHHAYHHVEELEHVADQILESLKPDGVLAVVDYVGANFLQRTERQRDLCSAIWRTMPERYRLNQKGQVVSKLRIPPKESLSPYEAIRAEDIVEVLDERFEVEERFFYAGILFPLFNGFARNYDDDSEADQEFLRLMWDLDRWLIETGNIEPNFMKAIYRPPNRGT
ncbi:MAG: class I SAM-dependent methyltransferase, partial [Halobacteriales archaeon]|nr:class I SAM-dependent methyltransferase [Halobacteriales archaeon]